MHTNYREPSRDLKRKVKYVARPGGGFDTVLVESTLLDEPQEETNLLLDALRLPVPYSAMSDRERREHDSLVEAGRQLLESDSRKKAQAAHSRNIALLEQRYAKRAEPEKPYPATQEAFIESLR